jgi:hypothetical protein
MRSPPVGGSKQYLGKHTLALLAALVVPPGERCLAQSTAVAPAPAAAADSAPAVPSDSAPNPAAGASGDTTRTTAGDTAASPARPAPAPAPVDSALGAACAESSGGPPDLLVVRFRAGTTEAERAAVAQELGGTVVGPSEHTAPGSWFLSVPGSGGVGSVADRLIMLPPVLEVGTTRCPS